MSSHLLYIEDYFYFILILPRFYPAGTLGLVLIVFEGALELRYSRDKTAL